MRLGLVATAAVLASVVGVGSTLAADSGTVTVTGSSAGTIRLTLGDSSADFGTDLTPDGNDAVSTDVVGTNIGGAGTCYEWSSVATVRSNLIYDVKVGTSAAGSNARVHFLTADPDSFATCVAGRLLSDTMSSGWVSAASRTSSQAHAYWLGLEVLWTDAPSGTLGSGSLTLTAQAAP